MLSPVNNHAFFTRLLVNQDKNTAGFLRGKLRNGGSPKSGGPPSNWPGLTALCWVLPPVFPGFGIV